MYSHGHEPLETFVTEWSVLKLGMVAEKIADRLFGKSKRAAKEADRQESYTEERRTANGREKKTFMSWKDMAKRAAAGENTSIRSI